MTVAACLDEVLEQVLGEGGRPPAVPCLFRDGSLLGLVGEEPGFSDEEYRRAVDRRAFEVVRRFGSRDFATAVVRMRGRQVGTLGSIVATGRSFDVLGHVLVTKEHGSPVEVIVQSGLVGQLTASGVRVVPADPSSPNAVARVVEVPAADRDDLLDGDVEETYWARSWGLPLRLARLAVMLMASLSPRVIGERSRLSLRSVRTYTEALFERARVHSRGELVLAALRDGRAQKALP